MPKSDGQWALQNGSSAIGACELGSRMQLTPKQEWDHADKQTEDEDAGKQSPRQPAANVPLNDGYFEIAFPKVLFEDNPNSITVYWLDSYR